MRTVGQLSAVARAEAWVEHTWAVVVAAAAVAVAADDWHSKNQDVRC